MASTGAACRCAPPAPLRSPPRSRATTFGRCRRNGSAGKIGIARHRRVDGGAKDEQRPIGCHLPDRHEASRAAPSRSPRYTPERILPHQAGLSRYQRTVLRSPLSKVSRGSQPSSRLILPASMA